MQSTDETILMHEDPSPQSIKRWGYDRRLAFADVDEELLLASNIDNYPALLDLASDQNCPKQWYALYIVAFQSDYDILNRREERCRLLRERLDGLHLDSIAKEWWREFNAFIDRVFDPRPFTTDEAAKFAHGSCAAN